MTAATGHTHKALIGSQCKPGRRCCAEEATFAALLTHLRNDHDVLFTAHDMGLLRTGRLDPVDLHHRHHSGERQGEVTDG